MEIRDQAKQIASEHRRIAYRRIHVPLEREGIDVDLKRLVRIYGEEKLQVKSLGCSNRALRTRKLIEVPTALNVR